MMFFTAVGWGLLFIFALAATIMLPWIVLALAEFGGGKGKGFALVPFLLGCLAIWALCHYAPFHITIS
ncbi:hypothetical protein CRX22_10555 [Salmonella enterica subsp. enterica serovar Newport]|jgi:hypothetical protein|nr:hypothetical protein [Salmonella enterica subsp. enterica serovar Newport]